MGVSDVSLDCDKFLQFAMGLDIVNKFLYVCDSLTEDILYKQQKYLFRFGKTMVDKFQIDAYTKLHRLMRHFWE